MFDFLKKKIASWIAPEKKAFKKSKKTTKKKDSKSKKPSKKEKPSVKTAKEKEKHIKSVKTEAVEQVNVTDNKEELKKLTKSEQESKEEVEEILEEAEQSPESKEIDQEVEEKEEKKSNFFTKLFNKITSAKLSNEDFEEIFAEFEITLLENNVALEAVDKIKASLAEELINQQVKKADAEKHILQALKTAILSVLQEPPNLIEQIKKHSGIYTIIFFGINGTGKTTSIAKIAHLLKKNKISCVLAAADTFRAASIEQLRTHADRVGVPIIASNYGSDPASVIFEAKKYAEAHKIKVVLADTAGRMYTKENLIKEMEKMIRVNKPDLKIFVGESITGNDALVQCKTFNEAIGIDGIILSKSDIDEKAGTILSVSHVTNKPIYFLGTGQNYEDLLVFSKKAVLKNLGLE